MPKTSVYIKGMEMPKNEPLLVKINPDGSVSTTAKNGYKKYKAVPVPPHERLIDKDAIRKKCERGEYPNVFIDSKELAAEFYAAPTIIPAEEEADA